MAADSLQQRQCSLSLLAGHVPDGRDPRGDVLAGNLQHEILAAHDAGWRLWWVAGVWGAGKLSQTRFFSRQAFLVLTLPCPSVFGAGIAIGLVTMLQIDFTSPLTHNISGTAKVGLDFFCLIFCELPCLTFAYLP